MGGQSKSFNQFKFGKSENNNNCQITKRLYSNKLFRMVKDTSYVQSWAKVMQL